MMFLVLLLFLSTLSATFGVLINPANDPSLPYITATFLPNQFYLQSQPNPLLLSFRIPTGYRSRIRQQAREMGDETVRYYAQVQMRAELPPFPQHLHNNQQYQQQNLHTEQHRQQQQQSPRRLSRNLICPTGYYSEQEINYMSIQLRVSRNMESAQMIYRWCNYLTSNEKNEIHNAPLHIEVLFRAGILVGSNENFIDIVKWENKPPNEGGPDLRILNASNNNDIPLIPLGLDDSDEEIEFLRQLGVRSSRRKSSSPPPQSENFIDVSDECRICHHKYKDHQKRYILLGCRHEFHTKCVAEQLKYDKECAVCRRSLSSLDEDFLANRSPSPELPPTPDDQIDYSAKLRELIAAQKDKRGSGKILKEQSHDGASSSRQTERYRHRHHHHHRQRRHNQDELQPQSGQSSFQSSMRNQRPSQEILNQSTHQVPNQSRERSRTSRN